MPVISAPSNRTERVNIRSLSHLATAAGDFAPVVAAAKTYAVNNNYRGLYAPADRDAYRFFKPAPQTPSIDLNGLTDFDLVGDGIGTRFQMTGSGGNGSWSLVRASGNCQNVYIRDIWLDGNSGNLTDLDAGQHTHTLQIGGGTPGGSAKRVTCERVRFTDTDGDGVALIAADAAFGSGQDVSGVDILNCKFLNCHRSGISNQRAAELVRILHNEFEGTSDQDVDLEPTGSTANNAPRDYMVAYNIMRRANFATAGVSNSGVSGTNPALRNVLAYNKIFGTVGGISIRDLMMIGNFIQPNVNDTAEALAFQGAITNVQITQNHILRPVGTHVGKLFTISGANGFYPYGVQVWRNKFHTYVGTDSDACLVLIQNADYVEFFKNQVFNYGSGTIASAISVLATSANGCKGTHIDRNWIFGNLGGGAFTNGINGGASNGNLAGWSAEGNGFLGCTNHHAYSKSGSGAFSNVRIAGNVGSGAEFASGSLAAIGSYLLAGNLPGVGHYAGDGAPTFSAAKGSTYIRRDGSAASLLYVATNSSGTWSAYA